jgi:hypothetical protein
VVSSITISGNVSDFGLQPLAGLSLRLEFWPSSAAGGSGNQLLATEPGRVTPDSSGDFSVPLAITEGLTPDAWYELVIVWLNPDGGLHRQDEYPGKLRIPIVGGSLSSILAASRASGYVAVTTDTPSVPAPYWLDPVSGTLYQLIGE